MTPNLLSVLDPASAVFISKKGNENMPAALNSPRNSAQALLLHLHRKHKTTLTGGCVLVDTSRKTSNQLKTYLKDFWEFYSFSPNLQKALETVG